MYLNNQKMKNHPLFQVNNNNNTAWYQSNRQMGSVCRVYFGYLRSPFSDF